MPVFTPDDIMDGAMPEGRVAIYDDDDYYMGGVLAEKLAAEGCSVTLVTGAAMVSRWTEHTMEQHRIQARLLTLGVGLALNRQVVRMQAGGLRLACTYTGRDEDLAADSVVLVTGRIATDGLARDLQADPDALAAAGIRTVQTIGDAYAPGHIAAAVYAGHMAARRHGETGEDPGIYRIERTKL